MMARTHAQSRRGSWRKGPIALPAFAAQKYHATGGSIEGSRALSVHSWGCRTKPFGNPRELKFAARYD